MDINVIVQGITALTALPFAVQFIIGFLIGIILLRNILDWAEYKYKRQQTTHTRVMSYVDSILKTILHDSIENMRAIYISKGDLTQGDKDELNLVRFALTSSLLMETKHHIKSIIDQNGYYEKVVNGKSIDDLIVQRANELRDISSSCVESILRSSSPLVGIADKRFSYEESVKLYKLIVDKHVEEIRNEEQDINDFAKKRVGIISKLIVYKHRQDI